VWVQASSWAGSIDKYGGEFSPIRRQFFGRSERKCDESGLRSVRYARWFVAAGIGFIATFVVMSLVEDRSGDVSLSDCRRMEAQAQPSGERSPAFLRRLEQRCAVLAEEAVDSDVPWVLPFVGGLLVAGGVVVMLNEKWQMRAAEERGPTTPPPPAANH
jgi:hypothetical protein